MVEFRVLGPLEVLRNGSPVQVPSRRQRALITRLLLSRGRVVAADALVDAVWEDAPPRDSRHALHSLVSRLRTLLGRQDIVVTRPPGYLLAADPAAVDAERFEAGATSVASAAAGKVQLLDDLLGLWRGPAYAEFAGTFAQAAAVRLEERRRTLREHRAEAMIDGSDLDRAVGELSALVTEDPIRERPHALLMRALYLAGRQPDALAVYHRFRDRLRDELGLDPSPELRQVHEQVLRQSITPAAPATSTEAPAVPAASPRPGPPSPAPASVPPAGAPPTSFVGRDRELRLLTALVSGGTGTERIVSLVGPGGVGKTRLARELVARTPGRQVWWVDLAAVTDPAAVPYRLVDALGLPQPAGPGVAEFLVDKLRPVRALLVADNCEHVTGPAADLLARIVAGCPQVTVVATSREPLSVAGERVVPVEPLPIDPLPIDPLPAEPLPEPAGDDPAALRESPAVVLFEDRLRAAGGPELTPAQVRAAAEICRRVGGLPLAVELAAARARNLGLAAVAQRPTLDLLAGGRRGAPQRHRSLRAVLDWSHDLLSTEERVLFRRLGAFAGPFTLDDAEQVCADATAPADRLAGTLACLVERSMVAGPAADRFRLLAPMRAYASEKLTGHGEERWLGGAHARHFVHFAESASAGLRTVREREWVNELADRMDELRAVHHWACAHDADLAVRLAVALSAYASYHMRIELQDWAATAAALPAAAGHPRRATALASAASGAWARGDFARAQELAREGLAAAPPGGREAAAPQLILGDVALLAGRLSTAAAAYRQAAALAGTELPHVTCEALGGQALVCCYEGDQHRAQALAAQGEQLAQRWGAPGLVAMARYFAGECRISTDPDSALAILEESRRIAADAGALLVVGFATLSAVSLRGRNGGDPAAALAAYREAIEHWRRVGNHTQQWLTLRNLLPVLVRAGQAELALTVHGALGSAPVQLPAEVVVPEAEALAAAVDEARERLGDRRSQVATGRGARMDVEELAGAVLVAITASEPGAPTGQAGSSR